MLSQRTELKLSIYDDTIIIDETVTEASMNLCNELVSRRHRQVMDTKDQMIREALIKLGWTPPPDVLHSRREDATGA